MGGSAPPGAALAAPGQLLAPSTDPPLHPTGLLLTPALSRTRVCTHTCADTHTHVPAHTHTQPERESPGGTAVPRQLRPSVPAAWHRD